MEVEFQFQEKGKQKRKRLWENDVINVFLDMDER